MVEVVVLLAVWAAIVPWWRSTSRQVAGVADAETDAGAAVRLPCRDVDRTFRLGVAQSVGEQAVKDLLHVPGVRLYCR